MDKNPDQFRKENEEIVNRLKISDIAKITYNKTTGELLAYMKYGRSDIFGSKKFMKPVGPEYVA